jgi:DNA-directed RNA polymerase subunit RPC12/RpoP
MTPGSGEPATLKLIAPSRVRAKEAYAKPIANGSYICVNCGREFEFQRSPRGGKQPRHCSRACRRQWCYRNNRERLRVVGSNRPEQMRCGFCGDLGHNRAGCQKLKRRTEDRIVWLVGLLDDGEGAAEEDVAAFYGLLELDSLDGDEFARCRAEMEAVWSFRKFTAEAEKCRAAFGAAGLEIPDRLNRFFADG